MKQIILLGSPEYYNSDTRSINNIKAKGQLQRLKKHYESRGVIVKVVQGSEKYTESVYITDSALIINDFAIVARFHKTSRRGEEELTADYLKHRLGLRLRYLPKEDGVYFEGGDIRWSHDYTHIWFGYGVGRSTLKGIEAVEKILREELGMYMPIVHKLKLEDKKTFHLDLAFLPLPNGRALYYPTISAVSLKQIESAFGKTNVIKVPLKYFYACNSVWIDEKNIMVPKLPYDDFRQWMSKATQMKIDEVNVDQFHLFDGSIQCLTLRVWNI